MNLIALIACIVPYGEPARDSVDVAEVNSFYDEQGRLVFDQVIFYEWSREHCRHQVRAWRLVKCPHQIPYRDWDRGGYTAIWQDGDLLRNVNFASVRRSWTQYDPELAEREWLAKERRRELSPVRRELLTPTR